MTPLEPEGMGSTVVASNCAMVSPGEFPGVKPAAGRRATSDFSCGLIDKWTKGPLEMRVDC